MSKKQENIDTSKEHVDGITILVSEEAILEEYKIISKYKKILDDWAEWSKTSPTSMKRISSLSI